jgi:uncharacterized OsmC-like protein
MNDLRVNIKASSENPTKTIVNARGFNMIIDEPRNFGGTNEGANPLEYMLGALGGCLNVVGHMVAREMGFALHSLEIELRGNMFPARFMGHPTEERAGFRDIEVTVHVDADADSETLDRWVEAVEDRCPVSDNLRNATPLRIIAKRTVPVNQN